ncbi:biopolymer transporter Tol [Kiritimatiellaeota bacterium B1221]|nr:biopolymer transporter Tol [Kiritimatiellaeota bacterium B1221]
MHDVCNRAGSITGDWEHARIEPVGTILNRHTLHSYFVTAPESPNGKWVVFFASTDPTAERGDLILLERSSGKEKVLASGIQAEDAHRGACQQWITNRYVVYHDGSGNEWIVYAVEIATGERHILARDRQLGFGAPQHPWVPVYGKHWNPGPHRNLELIQVETGEVHTPVTADDVINHYPEWIDARFGSRDLSIFFPVLSPDAKKVFFKMAKPGNGPSCRGNAVSDREGKVVFNLETNTFIRLFEFWGHPSWQPDGSGILEKGNFREDLDSGHTHTYSERAPSNHPSYHPSGQLYVSDADVSWREYGQSGEWAIIVGSCSEDRWLIVDQFNQQGGASSWRRNHPHPIFNAAGNRLYYNVSRGDWTRLMVATPAVP